MRAFQKRLTVSRAGGGTYVIDIGFVADNPDRAAEITNAVADGFIADNWSLVYDHTTDRDVAAGKVE